MINSVGPVYGEGREEGMWDVAEAYVLPNGRRHHVSLFRDVILPISVRAVFLVFVMYLLPSVIPQQK